VEERRLLVGISVGRVVEEELMRFRALDGIGEKAEARWKQQGRVARDMRHSVFYRDSLHQEVFQSKYAF